MKKIVKLFGVMTIAAALLISCKPSTEDPDAGKESDTKTEQTTDKTDAGNTDDKKDDATGDGAGAEDGTTAYLPITKEFTGEWADYGEVAIIDLSKVNAPATWTKVAVICDVYDESGEVIALASDYTARVAITLVNSIEGPFWDGSKNPCALGAGNYNGGVADQTLAYQEGVVGIQVQVKTKKVSKVVVKEVKFE